jgi:cystathionine beta-lyase
MSKKSEDKQPATRLVHAGYDPFDHDGFPNPPIAGGTTIFCKDWETFHKGAPYGRIDTPLSRIFAKAVTELEGGYDAVMTCSGMAAVTTTLMALTKQGDHVLIADSCYSPTRMFAEEYMSRYGIETQFYDPMIGAGISGLIKDNTSLVLMETPGSITYEVQDVPAIIKAVKEKNPDIVTIVDNIYSAGLYYRPLDHGADVSFQSAAKYICGHSDINLGVIVADEKDTYERIKNFAIYQGACAGKDDLYQAVRGLKTLKMRMDYAQDSMLQVLEWFKKRPEAKQIYSPSLEGNPGHDVWKRDFTGANGLLSVLFNEKYSHEDIGRFVDSLEIFKLGGGWGGFESLVQPQDMKTNRPDWDKAGVMLRFQMGNEDPQDLIKDLEQAIEQLEV